jgi:ArsR family transcriptional regulator
MPVTNAETQFLAATKAAADPLRSNILKLLRQESFGVLELAHILDTSQPTLSHHLKILAKGGLVASRRDGNSIFYRRALVPADCPMTGYLGGLFGTLDALPVDTALTNRRGDIYRQRAERSKQFFTDHADEFADKQALITTADVYLPALAELIEESVSGTRLALDVGPGDGDTLLMLAHHFDRVIAVDSADAMLDRARRRATTAKLGNVAFERSDFTELSAEQRFDAVLFSMVLHHSASPTHFFTQAARLLTNTGVLVLVELCAHDQAWAREVCGDQWLGFEPGELDSFADEAGLTAGMSQYLAQRNGFRIQLRTFHQQETSNDAR